jgi:hypothetical protein
MAKLMIRCPATGRPVFTGIETHPASIAMLPPVNTSLVCSLCGNTHIWSMLDVEFVCEPVDRTEPPTPELQLRLGHLRRTIRAGRDPRPTRRTLPRAS